MADPEAQFLQSRKSRAENRRHHTECRREALNTFWAALKSSLTSWKERLHALKIDVPCTEEQKRTLRLTFCQLEDELKQFRKSCLTESSLTQEISGDLWNLTDLMTVTDISMLHTEFSKCQTELDEIRRKALPKGKFVFRRYREALRLRADLPHATSSLDTSPRLPKTAKPLSVGFDPDRTIADLRNLKFRVDPDGSVNSEREAENIPALADCVSSIVLNNLKNCEIELCGNYESLHILSVVDSAIRVRNPVTGAIHVTGCHDISVWTQSQQLRLHESTDLHCYSEVSAGAILEDCTGVVFHRTKASLVEVRDFNWLKQGIASPNYSIQEEMKNDATNSRSDELNCLVRSGSVSSISKPRPETAPLRSAPVANDDEDDEL